ncbi:Saposin B-type domain-containing protein [Caenorhabditis elegans]|uniref:Saposin B-type domain-containing protein n=1 Tax=Caenorhabditis elegans TaxID=6239 RepID=Q9N4M7_CAEEL|nr:Saposin B-type domain-containing protein [Caenorhabditis elegans]CCD71115.1 Saposin B-type domain-containing protein [Caenorhabditis elegans]|eukprot:NP_500808.1 SaPosin-like Protein family [Caenorhabditis elegans]
MRINLFFVFAVLGQQFQVTFTYFWNEEPVVRERASPSPNGNTPSNLGCFMCTQLLSVTKHRVGLSENQLRNQLYEKCRVLPSVFKEQCFAFVETSLPEIYYSINYDISSKDVCVRMNFCDERNPFAIGGPLPSIEATTLYPEEEAEEIELPTTTTRRRTTTTTTTTTPPPTTTTTVRTTTALTRPNPSIEQVRREEHNDRIGHKNVLEIIIPPPLRSKYMSRNTIVESSREKVPEKEEIDEKRLTCAFCERMLENAKNYAVTSKTDITSFANTACASLAKGTTSDQCYQMADKKIAELAKFVDQQVVDALWCAELNRC